MLAEELGFDGYGVGEYPDRPFLAALWPHPLEAIVAHTARITIFTAVIGMRLLDPLGAIRDYSELNQRAGGRLELVLGYGDARSQAVHDQFRRQWEQARTVVDPRVRPPRIWHRCALSRFAADIAARYDDPIFLSEATAPYAGFREWYRLRRAHHGHDPDGGLVGAGGVAYYGTRRSQDAIAAYRPIFDARLARLQALGLPSPYASLEDAVQHGAILVGSPQQIIDALMGQRDQLRHDVIHVHADADGLTASRHRATLELFQSEIAPAFRDESPPRPVNQIGSQAD